MQAETIKVVIPKLPPMYKNVHYEYDENISYKQYKKWNKYNTGNYVYILDGNSTSRYLSGLKNNLIFVKDDNLEWSINLCNIRDKRDKIKNHHPPKYDGKKKRCGTPLMAMKFFNKSLTLDYRFPIKHYFNKTNLCQNIKLEYEYDVKYGYTSFEKEQCMGTPNFNTRVNYAYGFLLLPGNVKYTHNVINKILDKYEKALECADKKLHNKSTNNEQNLTLLEKAVGKEKLECLDKYLVWDGNESK